jgi:plasmid segregation protein ParM
VGPIHTKIHTLDQQIIFPSLIAPTSHEGRSLEEYPPDTDVVTVEVNGHYFTAGRDSSRIPATQAGASWNGTAPNQTGYLALLRTAFWYIKAPAIELLVVGLPINALDRHQKTLTHQLAGRHCIPDFSDPNSDCRRSTNQIEVRRALVMPQAVVALFAAAIENPLVKASRTLVLDFSYYTLDILCATDMLPIWGQQGSIPGGVSGFIATLAASLSANETRNNRAPEPIDPLETTHDLSHSPIRPSAWAHNIKPHIQFSQSLLNHYIDQAIAMVPGMVDMQLAVLTGSGADLLAPLLQAKLPGLSQIITPQNPQRAIARGMFF